MAAAIAIGDLFYSFEDLKLKLAAYSDSHCVDIHVHRSKTLEAARKTCPARAEKAMPSLKYYLLHYKCVHGGNYRKTGSGVRRSATFRKNCPFRIYVTLHEDCNSLIIRDICEEHNHEVSERLYKQLPNQRRLLENVKDVASYLQLKTSSNDYCPVKDNKIKEANTRTVFVKTTYQPKEKASSYFTMLEAIKYKRGKLEILDQLLLPARSCYENIDDIEGGWQAIKLMKVRGAPAISIVAALSLAVDLTKREFASKEDLHQFVLDSLKYLATSRPTAVNLCQVIKLILEFSEQYVLSELSTESMKNRLIEDTEKLLASDIRINRCIGEHGGTHILANCPKKPVTILTHCNTGSLATAGYGTALGVIRWLFEHNSLQQVYCTETRPYNQGARLTAYELVHDRIPSTLICDSMVASLMKSGKVSAVIVGADRVVLNGDTANKIGTYQIAVCAKYHNIPFYVACPRSTFDFSIAFGELIPIEERPEQEMLMINSTRIAAEGIKCWNPAFDITPASLITGGIVTEVGVVSASALKENLEILAAVELFQ